MTWEDLTEVLISFKERVHVVRGDGLETVSLQVVPIAWFIAIKAGDQLNMGVYQGEENRLVGTASVPFAELTEEFVREHVSKALADQCRLQAAPDFLKAPDEGERRHE